MKNIEELSDRELLAELLKEQKKNNFHELVSAVANTTVMVVLLVLSLIFVPKGVTTLTNINKLVNDTNSVITQAEASIEKIDSMVSSVNDLVEGNTEAVNSTLENATKIDIDALNRSIHQLEDVIEPLSKFFSVFNR